LAPGSQVVIKASGQKVGKIWRPGVRFSASVMANFFNWRILDC
jgi:hypothetical protein